MIGSFQCSYTAQLDVKDASWVLVFVQLEPMV